MKQNQCEYVLSFFSFIATFTTLMAYFPSSVCAQDTVTPAVDSVLDKLEGEWVMTGTVANEKVTHDVYVDRILKRQYVRIHELSREKDADGEPAYEAWIHIAWDKEKAEYVVMWLDNTATTNFAPEGVGHGKPDGDGSLSYGNRPMAAASTTLSNTTVRVKPGRGRSITLTILRRLQLSHA